MLSFLRSQKKKNPTKNSSFYHRENLILNTEDLKDVFEITAQLKTNYKIRFQGISLDSIFINTLEKQFGEASYLLNHEEQFENHKIYYYRKTVETYTLLIQLHFIDDVFFFASTKLSSESSLLSAKEKRKIIEKLMKLYPDIKPEGDNLEYLFSDQDGNVIQTQDNVFLYINYYVNNESVDKMKKIAESTIFGEKPRAVGEETLESFL